MSAAVLYIHGFASCGAGNKVHALQKQFDKDHVISPHLPVEPEEAIQLLKELITENNIGLLVGSSLGGYYAEYLQGLFQVPAVLINPSTRPFVTLKNYIGMNKNWCTDENFEWKISYVDQIKAMERENPEPSERYLVLLQTDDEVIDYRYAESRYQDFNVVVQDGGNHRFENLHEYTQMIEDFMKDASGG